MIKRSESIKEIATALAKAGPDLKNPKKSRTVSVTTTKGSSYSYRYAELDGILEQVKPVLSKYEIALIQSAENTERGVKIITLLTHSSGEWLESELEMPVANDGRMNGSQALGSAITYGRRYSISALLAIAADEDDDAQTAKDKVAGPRASNYNATTQQPKTVVLPKATKEQKDQILSLASEYKGWSKEEVSKFVIKSFALKTTDELTSQQAVSLINGFQKKLNEQKKTEAEIVAGGTPEITPEEVDKHFEEESKTVKS